MTTTAPKTSDNFTIMHQFFADDPDAGPEQCTDALNRMGIEDLIDALDKSETSSGGVIVGTESDLEFYAYIYVSLAGYVQIWMTAFRDRTFERGLNAVARFSWNWLNQTPEQEQIHNDYATRIREIESRIYEKTPFWHK